MRLSLGRHSQTGMGGFLSAEAECDRISRECKDKIRTLNFKHRENTREIAKIVANTTSGSNAEIAVRMRTIDQYTRANVLVLQEINALTAQKLGAEQMGNTSSRSNTARHMIRIADEVRCEVTPGEQSYLETAMDELASYDQETGVGLSDEVVETQEDRALADRLRALQTVIAHPPTVTSVMVMAP